MVKPSTTAVLLAENTDHVGASLNCVEAALAPSHKMSPEESFAFASSIVVPKNKRNLPVHEVSFVVCFRVEVPTDDLVLVDLLDSR